MTSAPSPRTWKDGDILTYDVVNTDLYATWKFLLNPPMVKSRATTVQSIPNATWTDVNFDVDDTDDYEMHSTSQKERFYPKVPGYYMGSVGVSFAANYSGFRAVMVSKNGGATSTVFRTYSLHVKSGSTQGDEVLKGSTWGPIAMNGTTDYFTVKAYQSSGGSLNTEVGTTGVTDYELQPEFYARWVGKL